MKVSCQNNRLMSLHSRVIAAACLMVSAATCSPAQDTSRAVDAAESNRRFQAGLARVDITPDYPILMNGFLARQQASQGTRQPIWAKALAIVGNDNQPFLLITVDTLGIPIAVHQEVCRRLMPLGVDPRRVAITASHTHTAPIINGSAPNILGRDFTTGEQQRIDQYTREFTDKLTLAAEQALANRLAATLAWSVGKVDFAKNRRSPNGPVDHELPVLTIRDTAGKLIGLYVSYACHCVTLGDPMIGGDWAGYAQSLIEERHPECVALLSIGCAGDQNPNSLVGTDRVDLARGQGEVIATEVSRLAKGTTSPLLNDVHCGWVEIELPLAELPGRAEFEIRAKLQTPVGYHARKQLEKLDRGESLNKSISYPIQTWSFGNSLCIVFLAGEVTVEYGLRLKSELTGRGVWVNAYANACPCYIPSEKVLQQGGYEGSGAMIYYDQPTHFLAGLEDKIMSATHELFAAPPHAKP